MRGPSIRPLRLVVDRDTVADGEALEILLGFAHHAAVEVITTDPDDDAWLLEIGAPDTERDLVPVQVSMGRGRKSRTAVRGYRSLHSAARHYAEADRLDEVLSAYVLGGAAASARADALATRRTHALDTRADWIRRGNAMTPEEAVALLGLHLRLQGDFTYLLGGDSARDEQYSAAFDRGLFYWVLTRSLLPAAWRWFNACVHSSSASGDDRLLGLGGAALLRFDRVLRARDRVHEQFQVPQDSNTSDEAHFYLDVVLLQLVGVFDAVGRVAHFVYGVPGDERRVSWRREDRRAWRHALAQRGPNLAELMAPTRAARDTLELAAILRNTIHGQALEGVAVRQRAQTEYSVMVPSSDAETFVAAARRRGGLERWGIREFGDRRFLIAADRYIEALVPDAARAVNRLMRATDVSRLPGLGEVALPGGPPRGRDSVFDAWTRRRLRLLAGL